MNYADIKRIDVANGLGVRVSLFVSGCSHHCKGCFNEETWDFNYGKPFTEAEIEQILDYLKPDYIKGLSLLGGNLSNMSTSRDCCLCFDGLSLCTHRKMCGATQAMILKKIYREK